ncbi:hypothetical protein DM01DRAFT_300233 [Hesseltinella vesiculosa]|uniref:Uncharacterized protein n=1 Tax=Hesseltinella vesiculosa TaxID=101127 RepID=A0A1X2GH92_9FUNG|nr:hypothetical protein DM01DRAFT_300233 [Hesseltinella vesiculosa]
MKAELRNIGSLLGATVNRARDEGRNAIWKLSNFLLVPKVSARDSSNWARIEGSNIIYTRTNSLRFPGCLTGIKGPVKMDANLDSSIAEQKDLKDVHKSMAEVIETHRAWCQLL